MKRTVFVMVLAAAVLSCCCVSAMASSFRIVGATDGQIGVWADGATRYSSMNFNGSTMNTGFTTWYRKDAIYIRFNFSTVDYEKYVACSSAKLVLHIRDLNNGNGKPLEISRIDDSSVNTDPAKFDFFKNDTSAPRNWKTQPPFEGFQITSGTGVIDSKIPQGPGRIEMDVTNAIQKWLYEGIPNNGFVVQLGGPIEGIPGDPSYSVSFYSSEASNVYLQPSLDLELTGTAPITNTKSFSPSADGYMSASQDGGSGKDFAATTMNSGFGPWWSHSSSYIRFDLSSIAAKARRVNTAKLYLNVNSLAQPTTPVSLNVKRIAWANKNTDPALFSYNQNDTGASRDWSGGVGFQLTCGDGPTASVTPTAPGQVEVDVTSMVDAWLFGGQPNDGMVIQMGNTVYGFPGGDGYSIALDTSEATDPNVRPRLQVDYTPIQTADNQFTLSAVADGSLGNRQKDFSGATLASSFIPWWSYDSVYVRFDVSGINKAKYAGVKPGSARLILNVNSLSQSPTPVPLYVGRIDPANSNTAWDLFSWAQNDTSAARAWTGANSFQTNCAVSSSLVNVTPTSTGQLSIDVSSIVQSWLFSGNGNSGFVVEMGGPKYGIPGGAGYSITFDSSRATDVAIRPRLELELLPNEVSPGQYSLRPDADGYLGNTGNDWNSDTMLLDFYPWVRHTSGYLRFDLGKVNKGQYGGMVSATLKLNAASVNNPSGQQLNVGQVDPGNLNTDTTKMSYSQNNTTTGTNWTNNSFSWSYSGFQSTCTAGWSDAPWIASQMVSSPGPVTFDVQSAVNSWLYGGVLNNGFILKMGPSIYGVPGGTGYSMTINTSESADQTKIPVLELALSPFTVPVGSIADAKKAADGTAVLVGGYVSADFMDYFYIENADRSAGIRVVQIPDEFGDTVDVTAPKIVTMLGTIRTNTDNERYIEATWVDAVTTGYSIAPVGVTGKSVGGGQFGAPPAGQEGTYGSTGLNNIGLLVTVSGRVQSGPSANMFYLNDGSPSPTLVEVTDDYAPSYAHASVKGTVSCTVVDGKTVPVIRTKGSWIKDSSGL